MAGLPHLPWFIGDFMASTQSWSGEERGLYLLALGLQWTEKALPNDAKSVRKALNYDRTTFAKLWPRVSTKFELFEGVLINRRLEEHRSKAIEIQRRNAERATRAAHSRWDATSNAPSKANGMLRASNADAPSMPGEHAIQSNLIKNKNLEGHAPVDNSSKRAPQPIKGRGALDAPSMSPEGAANKAWVLLLASDGAIRPPAAQAALDAVPGGWSSIRMRTPSTEPGMRSAFVTAYVTGAAKP